VITRAEVAKLGALHAVEPTMLSLYLEIPPPPVDPSALTARADELIAAAEAAADQTVAERDRNRVRETLARCARDGTGHPVAIFACAGSGLLEAVPLPCAQPDRAVLGIRPHIRPLLAALQGGPGGLAELRVRRLADEILAMPPGVSVAIGLTACLAAVSVGVVATLIVPPDRLVPGYECGRCGALSLAPDSCSDWGTALLPVPDVIEEMVSRILEDGGEVAVVCDGSSPVAARLQLPVPR
jgi:hypothetical protein